MNSPWCCVVQEPGGRSKCRLAAGLEMRLLGCRSAWARHVPNATPIEYTRPATAFSVEKHHVVKEANIECVLLMREVVALAPGLVNDFYCTQVPQHEVLAFAAVFELGFRLLKEEVRMGAWGYLPKNNDDSGDRWEDVKEAVSGVFSSEIDRLVFDEPADDNTDMMWTHLGTIQRAVATGLYTPSREAIHMCLAYLDRISEDEDWIRGWNEPEFMRFTLKFLAKEFSSLTPGEIISREWLNDSKYSRSLAAWEEEEARMRRRSKAAAKRRRQRLKNG